MLNVAISVDSAIDHGPQADRVVSAACEEVIGEGRCPVASELRPGTVAAWFAIVHPNDPGLSSVRIEFRDRTVDGVLIEERSLTFSGLDSRDTRLASAGSVIAALVAAREGSLARAPRPAASVEAPRPDWSLDLAALVAPRFGQEPYRLGGLGRVHLGFWGRPFGVVSAQAAGHPGNPGYTWWTLSAGVGTRVAERAARFNLELGAELVFEHISIAVERGAQQDSAGDNGWGGRVGVGAVWANWRYCSVIFGVDGTLVLPRINVVVGGQPAERVPSASLGVALGLRFQP